MKIVAFLQNAWSPLYAGQIWPRRSWLKALERSRSGQRLRPFFESGLDIWWDNCNPLCGDGPSSSLPLDLDHVVKVLEEQQPQLVLTFGKTARQVLDVWHSSIIVMPHPAYRVVTNELFEQVLGLIQLDLGDRVEFKQSKNKVQVVNLEGSLAE